MSTTKITALPVLTSPSANGENTVFVVVDCVWEFQFPVEKSLVVGDASDDLDASVGRL